MIISIENLKRQVSTADTDELVTAKLEAIEAVIRKYTNNNFQQREVRYSGESSGMYIYGADAPKNFKIDDTVQISQSGVNDGLYRVTAVGADYIMVDKLLLDADFNLVTKVKYPADVVQCAIDLFRWKENMGNKVGIKSETISRHSVTYEDSGNLFMGYPRGILNGLYLHIKARC